MVQGAPPLAAARGPTSRVWPAADSCGGAGPGPAAGRRSPRSSGAAPGVSCLCRSAGTGRRTSPARLRGGAL